MEEQLIKSLLKLKSKRAQALALRWIMDATRKRKNKTMAEKLYAEIIDASQNKGSAIKKERIHIKWQRLIKLLHILDGKILWQNIP